MGTTIVTKTRPGGGGVVGATEVSAAEADGYTLLFVNAVVILYAPMVAPVKFSANDFEFISQVTEYQQAIVARADAPYNTLEEMIAMSANDRLAYADQGSITRHLINYIAQLEGVEWTAIPTKGGGEMVPFLLGGKVDFAYSGGIHGRYAEDMKVLASVNPGPLAAHPDIASIDVKYGVSVPGKLVVTAPAGVPAEALAKIEAGVAEAMKSQELIDLLNKMAFPVSYVGSAELAEQLTAATPGLQAIADTVKK